MGQRVCRLIALCALSDNSTPFNIMRASHERHYNHKQCTSAFAVVLGHEDFKLSQAHHLGCLFQYVEPDAVLLMPAINAWSIKRQTCAAQQVLHMPTIQESNSIAGQSGDI